MFIILFIALFLPSLSKLHACFQTAEEIDQSHRFAKLPMFATAGLLISEGGELSSGVLITPRVVLCDQHSFFNRQGRVIFIAEPEVQIPSKITTNTQGERCSVTDFSLLQQRGYKLSLVKDYSELPGHGSRDRTPPPRMNLTAIIERLRTEDIEREVNNPTTTTPHCVMDSLMLAELHLSQLEYQVHLM